VRRLQILYDLVGFDTMLKQPADLLADVIRAYAAGTASPSRTLPEREGEILAAYLERILRGDTSLGREVRQIVAHVKEIKNEFRQSWAQARRQTLTELQWGAIPVEERRALTFKDFFAAGAVHWAEALAEPLGVADACRRRGLDGLLELRPVLLCVGAAMSLVFAQVVGDGVQSREPKGGDAYDLWHALLASIADVFVTADTRLAGQLTRVPVDGFRVVTSLRALLDDPSCVASTRGSGCRAPTSRSTGSPSLSTLAGIVARRALLVGSSSRATLSTIRRVAPWRTRSTSNS